MTAKYFSFRQNMVRNAFSLMPQLSQSQLGQKKCVLPAPRDVLSGSSDCPLPEVALCSACTAEGLDWGPWNG